MGLAVEYPARRAELTPQVYFKPPNGVGDSLIVGKAAGLETLNWAVSLVDSENDAAEHYRVYTSTSPDAGFAMLESTANVSVQIDTGAAAVTFITIVAANLGGTSGDEPNP